MPGVTPSPIFENIAGSGHDDVLTGDDGANRLEGGAGADRLNGGAEVDWLSYLESDAAVTINLGDGTATGGHARGIRSALLRM